MTAYWDLCGSGLGCTRQEVFLILQSLLALFSLFSMVRILRTLGRKFQVLPLLLNLILMSQLLVMTLLGRDFEFNLASYILEILTYFLFLYMFMTLLLKVGRQEHIKALRVCNIILVTGLIVGVGLIVLVFTGVLSGSCGHWFGRGLYYLMGVEMVIYVLVMASGTNILKSMISSPLDSLQDQGTFQDRVLESQDDYIVQRRKQLIVILTTFTISIFIRVLWFALSETINDAVSCVETQGLCILRGNNALGEVILCLGLSVPLVAPLLLPFALYVIPISRLSRNSTFRMPSETNKVVSECVKSPLLGG